MERRTYVPSPKHGVEARGNISAAPVNGQDALDNSISFKPTTTRRVGIDHQTGDYVVFDQTLGNEFHGHIRSWNELTDQMRKALIDSGMVDKRGRIPNLPPNFQR